MERSGPALQAAPDGSLAAVGPATSSLSASISRICLQFPHSSKTLSVKAFPHPRSPLYVHCSLNRQGLFTPSAHSKHMSPSKHHHNQKQVDTHEEDVKRTFCISKKINIAQPRKENLKVCTDLLWDTAARDRTCSAKSGEKIYSNGNYLEKKFLNILEAIYGLCVFQPLIFLKMI